MGVVLWNALVLLGELIDDLRGVLVNWLMHLTVIRLAVSLLFLTQTVELHSIAEHFDSSVRIKTSKNPLGAFGTWLVGDMCS